MGAVGGSEHAKQRRQLQRLYVEMIAADGIAAVHRLLSEAVIAGRQRIAKQRHDKPKPKPLPKPRICTWQGRHIELGPAMTKLSDKRRQFVLHYVRGWLGAKEACRAAGYTGKHAEKVQYEAPVKAAIAEERKRS